MVGLGFGSFIRGKDICVCVWVCVNAGGRRSPQMVDGWEELFLFLWAELRQKHINMPPRVRPADAKLNYTAIARNEMAHKTTLIQFEI